MKHVLLRCLHVSDKVHKIKKEAHATLHAVHNGCVTACAHHQHRAFSPRCPFVLIISRLCLACPCCRWAERDQARHFQPPLWAPGGEVSGCRWTGPAHPATWWQIWQEHHEALTGETREEDVKEGETVTKAKKVLRFKVFTVDEGEEGGTMKQVGEAKAEVKLLTQGKRRAFVYAITN